MSSFDTRTGPATFVKDKESNYKPPSSITKDKISITPFFNMYRCV